MAERVTITVSQETIVAITEALYNDTIKAQLDLKSRYVERREAAALAVAKADRVYADATGAIMTALGITDDGEATR